MLLSSDSWIIVILENTFKFFETMMKTMYGILSANPVTFLDGDIWKVISAVSQALMGSAISLMLIFFYTGLFEDSAEMIKHKNAGYIVWSFIKLFLMSGIIMGSSWFLLLIFSAGGVLMRDLSKVSLDGGGVEAGVATIFPQDASSWIDEGNWLEIPSIFRDTANSLSFKNSIIPFVITLIAAVVILASSVSIVLMVYGRFFTLAMHMAIAPLPFACLAGKSTAQHFWTFIKSFIGVVLESLIIMVALLLFSAFVRSENAFGENDYKEDLEMIEEFSDLLNEYADEIYGSGFNVINFINILKSDEGVEKLAEFQKKYGLESIEQGYLWKYMDELRSKTLTDMLYKYLLQLVLMFLVMASTVKGADDFIKRRLGL